MQEESDDSERKKTIAAAETELGRKTEIFDQTMNRYNKLQGKYESLLHSLEDHENRRTHSNTGFTNPSESSELAEWGKMWQTIVSTALQFVPFKAVEPHSGAEQRQILIDIMKLMCDRITDPKESREYKILAEKYKRSKERARKMKVQCSALLKEIQQNRTIMEDHLRQIKHRDNHELQEKVSQLEKIVADHVATKTDTSEDEDFEQMVHRVSLDFDFDENDLTNELLIRSRLARKAAQRYTTPHTREVTTRYKSQGSTKHRRHRGLQQHF